MPELPEVETVARMLRPDVVGRRIEAVEVRWPRTVGGSAAAFRRDAVGARIVALERRAKFLRFDLERGGRAVGALVGHLRMTGRFHVEPKATAAGAYARVLLSLDDGRVVHFDDVRKFGRLQFRADPEGALADLGPEPLGPSFDATWLHRALADRRRRLKPLLLDQTFVAGLGNIYVDEALHRAGLHPLRPSHHVRPEEAERLVLAVRDLLTRAIARNGSSFDGFYRTPEGQPGGFQAEFRVYDRAGLACTTCATPVKRIVVGQRGTHFCPTCQPRAGAPGAARRPAQRTSR